MHSSASTHSISTKNVNDGGDDLKKGMKHFYMFHPFNFIEILYRYALRRRTAVRLYDYKTYKITKVQKNSVPLNLCIFEPLKKTYSKTKAPKASLLKPFN